MPRSRSSYCFFHCWKGLCCSAGRCNAGWTGCGKRTAVQAAAAGRAGPKARPPPPAARPPRARSPPSASKAPPSASRGCIALPLRLSLWLSQSLSLFRSPPLAITPHLTPNAASARCPVAAFLLQPLFSCSSSPLPHQPIPPLMLCSPALSPPPPPRFPSLPSPPPLSHSITGLICKGLLLLPTPTPPHPNPWQERDCGAGRGSGGRPCARVRACRPVAWVRANGWRPGGPGGDPMRAGPGENPRAQR